MMVYHHHHHHDDIWRYNLFADEIIGGNQRNLVLSPFFPILMDVCAFEVNTNCENSLKCQPRAIGSLTPRSSGSLTLRSPISVHLFVVEFSYLCSESCLWRLETLSPKTSASSRYKVQGRTESNISVQFPLHVDIIVLLLQLATSGMKQG